LVNDANIYQVEHNLNEKLLHIIRINDLTEIITIIMSVTRKAKAY